jgi:hypothetical protein
MGKPSLQDRLEDVADLAGDRFDPPPVAVFTARRRRRYRTVATMTAAAATVVVVALAATLIHRSSSPRPSANPSRPPGSTTAIPTAPAGFANNEFRMASPFGDDAVGPLTVPRATCAPDQITAQAATRRTNGGVLGVVRLVGAVVAHSHGQRLRCTLPISRGPTALITSNGQRLAVPLSRGDTTETPSNPRPDIAINNGDAIWGFAWLGSYCDIPANGIEIPLAHSAALHVPLRGPQPGCDPAGDTSILIDGITGAPGEPVQPPRPEYASLRLSGRIEPGTTSNRLAPIELTLRNSGSAPIVLDPCPAYGGRDFAMAHSGGFGDPISSGYLPCTKRELVIRPGQPLRYTVPATSLLQTPSTGAIAGSTVHVDLAIAGLPLLRLSTTAH